MIFKTLVFKKKDENGNYIFVNYANGHGFMQIDNIPMLFSDKITMEGLKILYNDIHQFEISDEEFNKLELKEIELTFKN